MSDASPPAAAPVRREYRLALGGLLLVVLFRALIYVFWERAHFDADQAITGLMAKHLAELRAFPVFWYGQSYMLAVEAWLAAPLFRIFGTSVMALKVPLLAINMAIVWLLFRALVRDAGLRPALAVVPALFFALPSAGISARLVEANGGNVEPFLYALLIWTLRARPAWCGFVLGLGFLHREFTLYGFLALLAVEALQGTLFTRPGLRRRLITLRTAAEVWLVVQWVKQYSSAAGPGTTVADLFRPRDNITELASRVCLDPTTTMPGAYRLATEHWPVLFGTAARPLTDFGIQSAVHEGGAWHMPLLALLVLAAIAGIVFRGVRGRQLPQPPAFCGFLLATALFSMCGYVVGRCGAIDFYFTRYELLSILGVAGVAGLFLRTEPPGTLRRSWIVLAAIWFLLTTVPHVQLYAEYLSRPPQDLRRLILRHLDARGATFATADYWIAYPLTFLADERIIVASDDFVRVRDYQRQLEARTEPVVRISRQPCGTGREIARRIYLCEP